MKFIHHSGSTTQYNTMQSNVKKKKGKKDKEKEKGKKDKKRVKTCIIHQLSEPVTVL